MTVIDASAVLGNWHDQVQDGTEPGVAAKFNPAEPRDKHGRWIHIGDLVDFGGGKGTLEGVNNHGVADVKLGDGKIRKVHVDDLTRLSGGSRPSSGGKLEWTAKGANYHHAGDGSYTLHYAPGGGWDVHEGHAESTKDLGPVLYHGKTAADAKTWAEGHHTGKDVKPPKPEPPKPQPPEPPKPAPAKMQWEAHGASYHLGRTSVPGQTYTLHYSPGGGWDVHRGTHLSTAELGEPLFHGRNAKEAKTWAEQHAGGLTKPEPGVRTFKRHMEVRNWLRENGYAADVVDRASEAKGKPQQVFKRGTFEPTSLAVTYTGGKDAPWTISEAREPKPKPPVVDMNDKMTANKLTPGMVVSHPDMTVGQYPIEKIERRGGRVVLTLGGGYVNPHYNLGAPGEYGGQHDWVTWPHSKVTVHAPPVVDMRVKSFTTPPSDNKQLGQWVDGNRAKLHAAAAAIYPGAPNRWNRTTVDKDNAAYGSMGWDGEMNLDPRIARGAADVLDPRGNAMPPVGDLLGIKVLLHEMHHAVGSKDRYRESADYQDVKAKGGGWQLEEGFTELGTWMTMGDFLKSMGAEGRYTSANPSSARRKVLMRLTRNDLADAGKEVNEQYRLSGNPEQRKKLELAANRIATAVDNAQEWSQEPERQLQAAIDALQAAGEHRHASILGASLRGLKAHPASAKKQTVGEYFADAAKPDLFLGNTTHQVSYRPQVAKAYNWLDGIAALEQEAAGKGVSMQYETRFKRAKALSIEVNAASGPDKRTVMTSQILRALKIDGSRKLPRNMATAPDQTIQDRIERRLKAEYDKNDSDRVITNLVLLLKEIQQKGGIPKGVKIP